MLLEKKVNLNLVLGDEETESCSSTTLSSSSNEVAIQEPEWTPTSFSHHEEDISVLEGELVSDTGHYDNDLLSCLCHQFQIHLNVLSTTQECMDSFLEEVKDHADFYSDYFNVNDIIEDLQNKTDSVAPGVAKHYLQIAASIFCCKAYLFSDSQKSSIKGRTSVNDGAIYIKEISASNFSSLIFQKESAHSFNKVPFFTGNDFVRDNIGRIHLPTPTSGKSVVYLRAQRFHPTSIATQVND